MTKYNPKNILEKEPAVIAGAITVAINVVAAFGLVAVSTEQLGAVNVGVVTLLTLFTRQSVTPAKEVILSKKDVKREVEYALGPDIEWEDLAIDTSAEIVVTDADELRGQNDL